MPRPAAAREVVSSCNVGISVCGGEAGKVDVMCGICTCGGWLGVVSKYNVCHVFGGK